MAGSCVNFAPSLPRAMFRFARLILKTVLLVSVGAVAFLVCCNLYVSHRSHGLIYTQIDALPARQIGLVLGTSPRVVRGQPNLHFESRMDAAAQLYHAGKVRHLLVSGDNRRANYNEPVAMRTALIARGVPPDAITCDFAGLRTLDSVVRAHRIFGATQLTIITQGYHQARALTIARHEGMDAIGFASGEIPRRYSIRTEIREVLARAFTWLDLHVLARQPRHLGKPEPIALAK